MITAGALTSYVVTPAQVPWQMAEKTYPNDPGYTGTRAANYTKYWTSDPIWLPSNTEIQGDLWNTPANLDKGIAAGTLTRTANPSDGRQIYVLKSGGNGYDYISKAQLGLRPCFHLNLSKILEDLTIKEPEQADTYTYNGLEQTIDISDFTNFDPDTMEVTNIAYSGALPAGTSAPSVVSATAPDTPTKVKLTAAGTYNVTLKTKSPISGSTDPYYYFKNSGTNQATVTLTVKRKQLTKPAFTAAGAVKAYSGEELLFNAPNYPNDTVASTTNVAYPKDPLSASITRKVNGTVSAPPYTPVTEKKTDGTLDIKVRDAGEYSATFKIEDKINYEWTDG
ncbi:MAG: hypothetical protein K2H43_04350, partial [Clostridia bacterium]|nr:hypothetical protein [Clostridia bacterium]